MSSRLNLDAAKPLKAVQPSVIDVLVEAVGNEGFDVTDQIEASKTLRER